MGITALGQVNSHPRKDDLELKAVGLVHIWINYVLQVI